MLFRVAEHKNDSNERTAVLGVRRALVHTPLRRSICFCCCRHGLWAVVMGGWIGGYTDSTQCFINSSFFMCLVHLIISVSTCVTQVLVVLHPRLPTYWIQDRALLRVSVCIDIHMYLPRICIVNDALRLVADFAKSCKIELHRARGPCR